MVLYLTISRFQWRSQKQNSASWYNFSVCLELALKKTLPKDEPNNNIQRSIWSKNYIDLTIFRVSISSDGCTGRSLMWIFMWFRLTRLGLTSSSLNPSKNWSWCLGISLSGKMKDKGHQKEEQRFSMILGTMLCVMLQHGFVLRDVLKNFSWNSSCLWW